MNLKESFKTMALVALTGAFAAGLIHALAGGRSMADALTIVVCFGTETTLWSSSRLPASAGLVFVKRSAGGTMRVSRCVSSGAVYVTVSSQWPCATSGPTGQTVFPKIILL